MVKSYRQDQGHVLGLVHPFLAGCDYFYKFVPVGTITHNTVLYVPGIELGRYLKRSIKKERPVRGVFIANSKQWMAVIISLMQPHRLADNLNQDSMAVPGASCHISQRAGRAL